MVMDGKRNLIVHELHQAAEALGPNRAERRYYERRLAQSRRPGRKAKESLVHVAFE